MQAKINRFEVDKTGDLFSKKHKVGVIKTRETYEKAKINLNNFIFTLMWLR